MGERLDRKKGPTVGSPHGYVDRRLTAQHGCKPVASLPREIAHLEILPGASSLSGYFGEAHPMIEHRDRQWEMELQSGWPFIQSSNDMACLKPTATVRPVQEELRASVYTEQGHSTLSRVPLMASEWLVHSQTLS